MEKELKQECIKRLEILKLDSKIIQEFKKNNKVYISKVNDKGTEVIFDNGIMELIKSLENKKTIKIYHIIISNDKVHILCVHSHKEEWKKERLELKRGFTTVVLWEIEGSQIIEFIIRDIGLEIENGKIKRVVTWKTKEEMQQKYLGEKK